MTLRRPGSSAATRERRLLYERARSRWLRPAPDSSRRLAGHASTLALLTERGEDALAIGAGVVAAVVALRLAVAPTATEGEEVGKWDAIESLGRVLPPSCARGFARLCAAARRPGQGSGSVPRSGQVGAHFAATVGAVAVSRVDHADRDLYEDVLWMTRHPDAVLGLLEEVAADARDFGRHGLHQAREGAEAYLDDVALALRVAPTGCAVAARRAELIGAVELVSRGRPLVRALVDAADAAHGSPGEG